MICLNSRTNQNLFHTIVILIICFLLVECVAFSSFQRQLKDSRYERKMANVALSIFQR
jgi:hypothetical protein